MDAAQDSFLYCTLHILESIADEREKGRQPDRYVAKLSKVNAVEYLHRLKFHEKASSFSERLLKTTDNINNMGIDQF